MMGTIGQTLFVSLVITFQLITINQAEKGKYFQTKLLLGNQKSLKAEIYQLNFECEEDGSGCYPYPVQESDLLWSSPDIDGISEVKYVKYLGTPAILATTNYGATVIAYPNGTELFHRELEKRPSTNIHSAEVLPDGNVVVACSVNKGPFAILYREGNTVQQYFKNTISVKAQYPHGVVWDKKRKLLYAAGYLTFLALEYSSGKDKRGAFKVVKNISLDYLYDESNKNENEAYEDGVHDLYPVDDSTDLLWLTTGEHVFTMNVTDFKTKKHDSVNVINSTHSNEKKVEVPNKGGVKGISLDKEHGLVLAKASPWFKEWYVGRSDKNYNPKDPVLLWSMPNNGTSDTIDGYCGRPEYDTVEDCRITFNLENLIFYKARVFHLNPFSY